MIIGSLMRPAPVFITAAILLAVSIISFYFFIKINRRNKKDFDRKLAAYNKAVEQIKQQEEQKAKARPQSVPVQTPVAVKAPVDNKVAPKKATGDIASSFRRIQFMAPNGASYDVPMIDSLTIGSSPECDLVIANDTVAGVQCRIRFADSKYTIQDLGSDNGTFVDGNPVPSDKAQEVKTGVLQMGKITLFMTIG